MTTGNIENWAGEIAQIGAIYPFLGSEVMLFAIGAILWFGWFIVQGRMEEREYQEELNRADDKR